MASLVAVAAAAGRADAQSCVFERDGPRWTLVGDCTTDHTIDLAGTISLDGGGHRIEAIDPPGAPFEGPVLRLRGGPTTLTRLAIDGSALGPGCREGLSGLAGVRVDGGAVTLADVDIRGMGRLDGHCDEGVGVEIIGLRSDAGGAATVRDPTVRLDRVTVLDYQKGGIVAVGRQTLTVTRSRVGSSQAQARLAANAVQAGLGTRLNLERNTIAGNSWCCGPAVATALLLVEAARGSIVRDNRIVGGAADVGIYLLSDFVLVESNFLVDEGVDTTHDIGILNRGTNNVARDNLVIGFDVPYDGPAESWQESSLRRVAADDEW